jgi:hypothetical protein
MEAVDAAREELDDEVDDEEEAQSFTMADEDNLMKHMMDCLALLAAVQKEEEQQGIPANSADTRMARNKVLMGALSTVGNSLLIDGEKPKRTTEAATAQLMNAFPVPEDAYLAQSGRKGWLPLHWALALLPLPQYNVTESDVKTLYAFDPMAMLTKHVGSESEEKGLTPAHLLCMNPVTPCIMQLIRSFTLCNATAFGSTTIVSALHVACHYGTPTVELLQHLLQLDSSQTKVNASFYGIEDCPLGHLCFNLVKRADELPNVEDILNCLLEVDKSKEVVGDAICGCLGGYYQTGVDSKDVVVADKRNSRLYGMIEMLLKANPEAATYRDTDGDHMLYLACSSNVPSELCIDIMRQILVLHNDAVREVGGDGRLPVLTAAEYCDVEVVEFLLGLYPGSASVMTSRGNSLLHLAVVDSDSSFYVSKVQYLCPRYPAMIQQRDGDGEMPVHKIQVASCFKTALALYEAGGIEQFKMPIAHPTNATYMHNGYLPLHRFIASQAHRLDSNLRSEAADMFRWLLRL